MGTCQSTRGAPPISFRFASKRTEQGTIKKEHAHTQPHWAGEIHGGLDAQPLRRRAAQTEEPILFPRT